MINNKKKEKIFPFSFGKNWTNFIKNYLNQDRINETQKAILSFSELSNFKEKSFLDIGCGSGIQSFVAYKLKAKKIISLDIDPKSIQCCKYFYKKAGNPKNWEILEGSILDKNIINKLEKYDFVYSWGVLHHTGKMWEAIKNAANLVKKNGFFYLAIYNKADGWGIWPDGRIGSSSFWRIEKKIYSKMPLFLQNIVDYFVMSILIVLFILTLKNPVKKIKEHKIKYRGMAWRTDIKDWLGGYPYEYASSEEIFKFLKKLGFSLENIKTKNGLLNNEYLFKKSI